jgi:hypothetical protein
VRSVLLRKGVGQAAGMDKGGEFSIVIATKSLYTRCIGKWVGIAWNVGVIRVI